MKVYSKNGKSINVKRGDVTETNTGIYKLTGKQNQLYTVREMTVSKNGNLYPIAGNKGEHRWSEHEVFENFK